MTSSFKENFKKHLTDARESREFAIYQEVRDSVLSMLEHATPESAPSDYWTAELGDSFYMLDASPLMVSQWQHYNYHISGLYSYLYRSHHEHASQPLRRKLQALKEVDPTGLLVPESPVLGGFGYEIDGELYNLDTLKFYEVLIGLEHAGFLEPIRTNEHPVVLEIGSGWGGFAYQFKTLFPHTSYVLVDLPQILLFSATYLRSLFPQARVYMGDGTPESYKDINFSDYDFVFIPNSAWSALQPQHVDLAINMISFQEMTDAQVEGYVEQLARWEVPRLYSLNRDISPNNKEITGVTAIINKFYDIGDVEVLPIPYHRLTLPTPSVKKNLKEFVKRIIGYKGKRMNREYRHLRATLPNQ